MKNKIIYTITFAAFLVACGPTDMMNKDLEVLTSTRDSLKMALAEIDMKIQMMDTTADESIPIVTASSVRVEDFVHKVEVSGIVETDKNAIVTAEASGGIKQIHVKEGQKVSKGQALITVDSEILTSTIDELETSLELAAFMFEKQEKLQEQGVGIEIEYEQAKNQKTGLEKKLKTMRSQKGKTIVRAPFTGIIDDIMVAEGEVATPQFPLLRIVNNDKVTVSASLSEGLLGKVNVGTPVEMLFPSLNDTLINSVVSNKGNYIDPTNRTFKIKVFINNNKVLLTNQFAKIKVTDFARKGATVIHTDAIIQDTDNNNYVYRITKTGMGEKYDVEKVFIKIIKKFDGMACVEANLSENDLVVVRGARGITESDQVKIQ